MKAIRTKKSWTKTEDSAKLEAAHCLGCGRIWVRGRDGGSDECGECDRELYPVSKYLIAGKELKLGDGYEARVSNDDLLRDTAYVLRALLDRTSCECSGMGTRCPHCKGAALLDKFPGPKEGTLEDDWATLKGGPPSQPEPELPDPNEMSPRQRQLMEDLFDIEDAVDDAEREANFDEDFNNLLEDV